MAAPFIRGALNSARGVHPQDISPQATAARRIQGFSDLDGLEFLARVDIEKDKSGADRDCIKVAVEPNHPDYAHLYGASHKASPSVPATLPPLAVVTGSPTAAVPQDATPSGKPAWGRSRCAAWTGLHCEMLGLQTPGAGFWPYRQPLRYWPGPTLSHRLGVLLSALSGRLSCAIWQLETCTGRVC